MEIQTKIWLLIVVVTMGTVLSLCPEGQYQPTNTSGCRSCSPCGGGMVVKENCFNMTNTICICPMGTWLHSGTQQCIPCTHPKMGQIYLKPCLQFEDAVVAYCPLGQYALNNTSCRKCSMCKQRTQLVKNCTKTSDIVCKDLIRKNEIKTNYGLIVGLPVAAVVILIFIASVILYIYYRRRRRDENENENVTATANTSMNSLTNIQYDKPNQTTVKKTYNRVNSQMSNISMTLNPMSPDNGDNSAAVIPRPNEAAVSGPTDNAHLRSAPQLAAAAGSDWQWQTTDLEHLDYNTRCSLAFFLTPDNPGKDWKNVASSLQLSNREILNLNESQKPVLDMIELYATKQGATIPGLYQAIVDNQRFDAAKLFKKFKVAI